MPKNMYLTDNELKKLLEEAVEDVLITIPGCGCKIEADSEGCKHYNNPLRTLGII